MTFSGRLGAYDRITPFVVPSNAPAGMKMAAQRIRNVMAPKWVSLYRDYIPILDGTADHVQVNDAIDLSAGRVDLGPGTITIGGSSTCINLESGMELAGAGWNKTIIQAATNTTNHLLNVNAGGSLADIYLHDFQVDGNSANQTVDFALLGGSLQSISRLIVERVWFKDAKNYGCLPTNAGNTEIWFINCKFTDFTHADSLEAIYVGATKIFIIGCVFDNIDIDNFISIAGATDGTDATDFMIIGNHFANLGSTGAQCVAVWTSSTESRRALRGIIAGNTGVNNHNSFRVYGKAGNGGGKVVIADNYMYGTGQATSWGGVWVDADTTFPVLISGGVYENFDSGIYAGGDDVEINGVIVENSWQAGVTLAGNRCRLIGGRVRNSRRRNAGGANNVRVSGDNCEVRGVHISDTGTAQSVYGLDIVYGGGTFTNGTGTATGSPITLAVGVNAIDVTGAGTFTIALNSNTAGQIAASDVATVTGSPVTLVVGSQTITVTGTGNINVTLTAPSNVVVEHNTFTNAGATANVRDLGTNTVFHRNTGWVTENAGTFTILSGAASATITHGLSYTPALKDISIVWGENPSNDQGNWWVDTIGATTFRVNVRNDPGASNLDGAWQVERH